MRTKEFLGRLEHQRIVEAIRAGETKTSGEIRVFIQRGQVAEDPLLFAERKFVEMGMTKTAERNAILILIAPRAQKFAIVGDEGVHRKCEPEFWQGLINRMQAHFQHEEFTDAIVEAIQGAGQLLASFFPRQHDDRDELPDQVIEG